MTPISRTQAYAKLVIAMVDLKLPAPKGIDMDTDGPLVQFDTGDEFEAWRVALGARASAPFVGSTGITSYSASVMWQGVDIVLSAMVHPAPAVEPVTEDLTRVREIAEHSVDEPRCPDPECGEPLALIASGAVGHCGRSCAPLDEDASAAEEHAAELDSYRREGAAEVEAEHADGPARAALVYGVADYRQPLTELERRAGVVLPGAEHAAVSDG